MPGDTCREWRRAVSRKVIATVYTALRTRYRLMCRLKGAVPSGRLHGRRDVNFSRLPRRRERVASVNVRCFLAAGSPAARVLVARQVPKVCRERSPASQNSSSMAIWKVRRGHQLVSVPSYRNSGATFAGLLQTKELNILGWQVTFDRSPPFRSRARP